jgi:hypothetical protein
VERLGTSVSPTLKPTRASLSSGDGVEGRFVAYSTPFSEIPLWTRKGDVFGWVHRCGSGSLGGRSTLRDKSLPVGGLGCVLHVESLDASREVSIGLVGFSSRACSASRTDRGTRFFQTRLLR